VRGTADTEWHVAAVDDAVVTLEKGCLRAAIPLSYVEGVHPTNEPGARWVIGLSCAVFALH